MIEFAKLTFPIPSGRKILDAYGKEISGKQIEKKALRNVNTAFFFSDFSDIKTS